MTVPGPFTMSQQAQNDFYETDEELALDYAAAVNEEIKDLFAAGADIVQIDEPYMQARPEKARRVRVCRAVARALDGVAGHDRPPHLLRLRRDHPRAPGGLLVPAGARRHAPLDQISIETAQSNLDTSVLTSLPGQDDHPRRARPQRPPRSSAPETVAERIRRALPHVPADRIVVAPDCGLKYLPRDVAFGKMRAMVAGAALARERLAAR